MKTQYVLSVSAQTIDHLVRGQRGFIPAHLMSYAGYSLADPKVFRQWLDGEFSANACFAQRQRLESDPTQRHIIPYVVLQHAGDGSTYLYSRTPHGGEPGLHGALSIGLGGHVDLESLYMAGDVDGTPERSTPDMESMVYHTILKELEEEVGYERQPMDECTFIGMLVQDGPTNNVHVGFVYVYKTLDTAVFENATEDAILYVGAPKITLGLLDQYPALEDWSKAVITYLGTASNV